MNLRVKESHNDTEVSYFTVNVAVRLSGIYVVVPVDTCSLCSRYCLLAGSLKGTQNG